LVELCFQLVGLGEFIVDVVCQLLHPLLGLLHFLLDSAFQVFDFFEVLLDGILLHAESGCCSFTVLQLILFKFEVALHVFDLLAGRQLVLTCHRLLHVLQELSN